MPVFAEAGHADQRAATHTGQAASHVRRRVTFGLLGPLEIHFGCSNIQVGSPKIRILLAALLLRTGRPLTINELSEAIWGDKQPDNPRRAVQLCATRLRSHLAEVGVAELLVTCADGYRLDVEPGDIDVGMVDTCLAAAHRANANGDPSAESNALADAIAHWRGQPLADIPSDKLQREATPRLCELLLQTLERRIDSDLRRGLHVDLVGELFELTSKHLTRERMWAQLMTALHRSGRRAEALDAYHTVRGHLADELGIDPGAELRQVHASVLTASPSVSHNVELSTVPRQLPPGVRGFVGRADEIARLDAFDDAWAPTICVITGMAGVGKTALAVHWARRVADRFPDGQLWADLRGDDPRRGATPQEALVGFLRALGLPDSQIPNDSGDQMMLYRSMMDGRRMLIVLDNAYDVQQVRPLLPATPGCHVLVTSRHTLNSLISGEAAHLVRLDVLTRDDARRMLAHRLGNERVQLHDAAVEELVDICSKLPLALAIVGARAASHPDVTLRTLATQLRQGHGPYGALGDGGQADAIRKALGWSYLSLSPAGARLFRLLAYHPGPDITPQAVASLAATTESEAWPLLAELSSADFVEHRMRGRLFMYDLARAYAMELASADSPDIADQCVRRLLDHFVLTARQAAQAMHQPLGLVPDEPEPGVTPEAINGAQMAMSWFAAECPVLLRMLDLANRYGFHARAWNLATCMWGYLERQGRWHDLAAAEQAALEAAQGLTDEMAEASARRGLGAIYARLGRFEHARAEFKLALDLAAEVDDEGGIAYTHACLAWLAGLQDKNDETLHHHLRALDMYKRTGDNAKTASTLGAIGRTRAQLGDFRHALIDCQKALAIQQATPGQAGIGATLDSLGLIHHRLRHYTQAIDSYRRALRRHRAAGDWNREAHTLTQMGDVYLAAGDRESAQQTWKKARSALADLDHPMVGEIDAKLATATRGHRDSGVG